MKLSSLACALLLVVMTQDALAQRASSCDVIRQRQAEGRSQAIVLANQRIDDFSRRQTQRLSRAEQCIEEFANAAKGMFKDYTISFSWDDVVRAAQDRFNSEFCRELREASQPFREVSNSYPQVPRGYPGISGRTQPAFGPSQRDSAEGDAGWWSNIACRFNGTC